MKLLKLIPAAAIVLTAFMPLEGKTEQICMYNNAAFAIEKMFITNTSSGASKDTGSFTLGVTKCIKLGDVPVPLNNGYNIKYIIEAGSSNCNQNQQSACLCAEYLRHTSSDEGNTYTYEVTGSATASRCDKQ